LSLTYTTQCQEAEHIDNGNEKQIHTNVRTRLTATLTQLTTNKELEVYERQQQDTNTGQRGHNE
jgi:hypothetical protein